jgi:hypothetical protein
MGRLCSRYLCFRYPGFSLFPVRWFVEVSGRIGVLAEVLTHGCIVQRLRIMPARHSMRFHYQGHFRREKRGETPCSQPIFWRRIPELERLPGRSV